jgi:hypothetical protein
MSEDEELKPIRRRIGGASTYRPPWSTKIAASLAEVDQVFERYAKSFTSERVDIVSSLTSDDVHYTVRKQYALDKHYTLTLTPRGDSTLMRMDRLPAEPGFYLANFHYLENEFKAAKIPLVINAPMISENEIDALPFLDQPTDTAVAPNPKRPSAKLVLTEYRKRHRRDRKLTLKQFCADIGANYDSIKAANWRYRQPKKRGRKRLP